MKRFFVLLVALSVAFAACGGDDDDDAGTGSDGSDVAGGDFCEVWTDLDAGETANLEDLTEEDIDEARAAVDRLRAAAPDAIEDEVGQMADAISGLLEEEASGEDMSEEAFAEVFALAFTAVPVIEEWMADNCPGYEPESGFDATGGSEFLAEDFPDGRVGVPGEDFAAMLTEAFPDGHHGFGGGGDDTEYDWTVIVDTDVEGALAACESFAEALSSHPDITGTLVFHIGEYDIDAETGFSDGDAIVENAGISAGDPGECVEV